MNLIIGIGLIVVWVVYKWRRPKQFRVIELDGQFYLEVKGWLTGIWWGAYAWDDGDISYDDFGTHKAYRSLSEVQKDLDAYAKYISRNKRKKVIKVVYRIEGERLGGKFLT